VKRIVLVVAVVGCAGKKQHEPPPPPPPQQPAPAATDQACVARTHELGDWLAALAAAGPLPFTSSRAHLAKLDGAAPGTLPELPIITLTPTAVELEGKLLGEPATAKPAALAKLIADAVASGAAKTPGVVLVIDDKTPWSLTAPTVTAIAAAEHGPISFAFEAGAPSGLTPPPSSAIDTELDALEKFDPSAKLRPLPEEGKPTLVDKVFAGCPKVTSDVLSKVGNAADAAAKDAILTGDLPKAIAACGCKVEMASVQRLAWAWYNRDTGTPVTAVTLDVGKPGTKLTAKPSAPWSETSKQVAVAAKQGKPVFFQ
jgi:hypothetical protein